MGDGMAKRKRREDGGGGGDWMNTYADMVTLLFAFFVMLFSMSSVETDKWEMLVKAFSKRGEETSQIVLAPGQNGEELGANEAEKAFTSDDESVSEAPSGLPEDLNQLYEYMKRYVEENNLEDSIIVSQSIGSVSVSFKNNIFFMPDSAVLTNPAVEILDFMGEGMNNVANQILAIKVSGHTARIKEIENYPISDWTLSTDRANSVVMYLINHNEDISSENYVSQGFGYNHPLDTNDTPEGRESNRRVDILILGNDVDFENPEEMEAIINSIYDTQLNLSEDDITTSGEN